MQPMRSVDPTSPASGDALQAHLPAGRCAQAKPARGPVTARDYTRPAGPLEDLQKGLAWTDLWLFLAWRRVRDSYRRTRLGPLWITVGVAAFVGGFSVIGSRLFGVDWRGFLPDLAVGFVLWQLVSSTLVNGCGALRTYAAIRQSRAVPFSVFLLSVLAAEVLKFLHLAVIWPVVALVFTPFAPKIAILIGLFPLVLLNLFLMSYVLAILCARMADLQYIVGAGLQLAFFLTPVIWPIDRLNGMDWVFLCNPLFYLIHPFKTAVLGGPVEGTHVWGLIALTLLNAAVFAGVLRAYYFRVQFWLGV